jgi:hypothetical protein
MEIIIWATLWIIFGLIILTPFLILTLGAMVLLNKIFESAKFRS